ncbi:phosphotransferase family protein [Deinococcus radiopugnans]|uniref:phosphotransferase family protein n=1 Tax=Deinococcus radiopugnans TaxID=57497 RepID=UPI000691FD37|nr:phosphotransferase [Deinococcus radiopugnans]
MAGGALGLAAGAIGRQFPQLAALPMTRLGEGSDHRAFAVGQRWVFRFPKHSGGGEGLLREARLLTWLAPRLPLPVPVPVFIGQPERDFPEAFTGALRLTGRSGLETPLLKWEEVGRSVGRFLRVLHAQDTGTARALGLTLDFDPTYSDWQEAALEDLGAISKQWPEVQSWREVLKQPPPSQPGRLAVIHGDLAAEHVFLSDRGEVTGILDWADAAIGDPARDLAGLIYWGGRAMLNAALSEYGETEAGVIERAAWYALCRALEDMAFGLRWDRPTYVEGGKRALTILHMEFADTLTKPR